MPRAPIGLLPEVRSGLLEVRSAARMLLGAVAHGHEAVAARQDESFTKALDDSSPTLIGHWHKKTTHVNPLETHADGRTDEGHVFVA